MKSVVHGQQAGSHIAQYHGDHAWPYLPDFTLCQLFLRCCKRAHPVHGCPHDDADAIGMIRLGKPGVSQGFPGSYEGIFGKERHVALKGVGDECFRSKILYFGCNADSLILSIKA